jgi:hypothetical protein
MGLYVYVRALPLYCSQILKFDFGIELTISPNQGLRLWPLYYLDIATLLKVLSSEMDQAESRLIR